MANRIKLSAIFALALFCITVAGEVFGGGFDNGTIGVRTIAMGAFHSALADDASCVYFNPGGLVFNDNNKFYAEIYGYYAPTKFKYTANSMTDESDEVFVIPGFFVSKRFDDWAFGFGSYIPYAGGGSAYDNFQNTGFDLESFAGWFALTPAVAYRLSEDLAVGIGLSAYIGQMEGRENGVKSEYDGFSGFGGHIGLFYKINQELNVGVTVRSEVPVEMDGSVKFAGNKFDSEVELTLPYYFSVGLGYEPEPDIMISLSAAYSLYNHLDEITIKTEGQGRVDIPTGYMNNWFLGLGMEYRTGPSLIFRCGVTYDHGATRGKWLNAKSNDVLKLTPRLGVGYDMTDSIELSISGLVVFGFEEEYDSNKYDQDNLSFTLGCRFKY